MSEKPALGNADKHSTTGTETAITHREATSDTNDDSTTAPERRTSGDGRQQREGRHERARKRVTARLLKRQGAATPSKTSNGDIGTQVAVGEEVRRPVHEGSARAKPSALRWKEIAARREERRRREEGSGGGEGASRSAGGRDGRAKGEAHEGAEERVAEDEETRWSYRERSYNLSSIHGCILRGSVILEMLKCNDELNRSSSEAVMCGSGRNRAVYLASALGGGNHLASDFITQELNHLVADALEGEADDEEGEDASPAYQAREKLYQVQKHLSQIVLDGRIGKKSIALVLHRHRYPIDEKGGGNRFGDTHYQINNADRDSQKAH
ncbi:hypothetical protein B0H14DRAFT_2585488 [Mycena olivaceomarginata]|nr:hypothetical protein B0H14DRAFT_2585488 [Mycena olivaceomarginata]